MSNRVSRVEIVKKHTSGDVLDVGCVQHNLENVEEETWLHEKLYDFEEVDSVLGIDVLESEITTLQEKGYNTIVQNAEEMDLDQNFDTIVAGELIEHLSNQGVFLESASNHLRNGGQLIITTPNTFNILRFLFYAKNGYVPSNDEHTCWYDEVTLGQLAERYGLRLEVCQKYAFKDELEFTDSISNVIRKLTPSDWTAESMFLVFRKME